VPIINSVSAKSAGGAYPDGACIIRVVSLNAEVANVKDSQRHVPLIA
jgi:hypothetical protein